MKLEVRAPGGSEVWFRPKTVATDADGRFSIPGQREGVRVELESVRKPGYKHLSGGTFAAKDGAIEMSDAVLLPITGKVEGRVVDRAGNPVAKATITCPDGSAEATAETDSDGRFTLTSVPEGELTLMAAHRAGVARLTYKAGTSPVVVTLSAPEDSAGPDRETLYGILEDAWKMSEGESHSLWWRVRIPAMVARYDADRALELARAADGSTMDEVVAEIITALASLDPSRTVEWGVDKLDGMNNARLRLRSAVKIGLAAADSQPEQALSLYRLAKDSIGAGGSTSQMQTAEVDTMIDYGYLAALAGRLGLDEAESMLEKMISAAEKHESPDEVLSYYASVVAEGSPELAEKLVAGLSPRRASRALRSIVAEVSLYDAASARKLLAKIGEISGDAASSASYGQAAMYVIISIGEQDPAGALEIARKVKDDRFRPLTLALAARYQEKDLALELFQAASGAARSNQNYASADMAWIAAMVSELDTKTGLDLFASARQQLEADNKQQERNRSSHIADFAAYYSHVDPAQSWLMLETELARCSRGPTSSGSRAPENIAAAMATMDVERALEIAREIPESDVRAKSWAMVKIARYALAPDDLKRRMRELHWTRSSAWIYGGPRPW